MKKNHIFNSRMADLLILGSGSDTIHSSFSIVLVFVKKIYIGLKFTIMKISRKNSLSLTLRNE